MVTGTCSVMCCLPTPGVRRIRINVRRSSRRELGIICLARMVVLVIRVKASIPDGTFNPFVVKLRSVARRVEDAAKWTMQRTFSDYPVFIGPIVAADIMLAGFQFAEQRYHHQVSRVMQNSKEARDLSLVDYGPVVRLFDDWARSVKPVKRVSPMKLSKRQQRAVSDKGAELWDAASSAPDSDTARRLQMQSEPSGASTSPESAGPPGESGSSVDMAAGPAAEAGKKIFYGVGRGFKPGVYASWDEADKQVKNFSGFRVRKFRSRVSAEKYVADVQAEPQTVWYVLKHSNQDGAYESKAARW